jgi:hypothetical protein
MDEERLFEKLRKIEAIFARATAEGERETAGQAKQRILERLRELEHEDPSVEYQFSLSDMWSRRVFLSLLRRYGLIPYRLYRQRYTTVMVRVSKRFVDETLWPEYLAFSDTLKAHLDEVTERVVAEVIQADSSEATVVSEPPRLTSTATPAPATPPPPAPAPVLARLRHPIRLRMRQSQAAPLAPHQQAPSPTAATHRRMIVTRGCIKVNCKERMKGSTVLSGG